MSLEIHFKYCLFQEAFPDLHQSHGLPPARAGLDAAPLRSPSILFLLVSFGSLQQMSIYWGNLLKYFITDEASNQKSLVTSPLDPELPES